MNSIIPAESTSFERAVLDADRADKAHCILVIAVPVLVLAVVAAVAVLAGAMSGPSPLAVAAALLLPTAAGITTAVASPLPRRAADRRRLALDIAYDTPEVLDGTEVLSPRLADELTPGWNLTRTHVLAYRARVAASDCDTGGMLAVAEHLLTEVELRAHAEAELAARAWFDGYGDAAPDGERSRAEIDRVGAEFVAALTGPDNLLAGDPLSDVSRPEVARLYDALAEAHAPGETTTAERARELNLAWIDARALTTRALTARER